MSPRLARAMEHANRARRDRAMMAARGCCPTCWKRIPGLEPMPPGEPRPLPWTYCDGCRAGDRDRKRAMLRDRSRPERDAQLAAARQKAAEAARAVLDTGMSLKGAVRTFRVGFYTLSRAVEAQRAQQARAA